MARIHRLVLLVAAFATQACDDAGDAAATDDTSGPSTSTGDASTTTGDGGAGGAGGSGSSTTSSMGQPCTPPGSSPTATPTPGSCAANAAVTCSESNSTLVTDACAADETCVEFTVTEHIYDTSGQFGWEMKREFDWAACIPAASEICDLEFNGNYWWNEEYGGQCVGDAASYCGLPGMPEYEIPGKQVQVGTPSGYIVLLPCGPGKTCHEPLSGPPSSASGLGCFPIDAPMCSVAAASCDGDALHQCDLNFGYEQTTDCGEGGGVCIAGCGGAQDVHCMPGGTQFCTENPPTCDTPLSYTSCSNCNTISNDCSFVVWFDPLGNVHMDPGYCAVLEAGPECVPEGVDFCDSSDPETCVGTVAKKCWGGWQLDVDCATEGESCFVGSNGEAGCNFAAAQPCTIGAPYACDGTSITGCCPDNGGLWTVGADLPCAPGYEATFDCTEIQPDFICDVFGPWGAECIDPTP